jgi:L-asparaginase II
MLATCVAAGWHTETYLASDHPLQLAIQSKISELCGAATTAVAVDGCGAPAFGVPLIGLARAFRSIALSETGAEAQVASSMRAHPQLVGGTHRCGTELMAAVPGLIAKDGAESVWGAALPDGRAMAAKLDDGYDRGLPIILASVLETWGMADGPGAGAVSSWASQPVLGGGRPHGRVGRSDALGGLLR